MKVKIGDKIYDGAIEPVMVILTDDDKANISNMPPNNFKYLSYPEEEMTNEEALLFMKT